MIIIYIQNFQGVQISEPQSIDIINYNFDLPGSYYLYIELDNNNGNMAVTLCIIYLLVQILYLISHQVIQRNVRIF